MRRLTVALAFSTAFGMGVGHAEIRFAPMKSDAQEAHIIAVKLPELAGLKEGAIESAVVQLGPTKDGSIVARIKTPQTCDAGEKHCRTVIIMAGKDDWKVVFDRKAETVDLGTEGFGAIKQVVVDHGYEVWNWNGYTYHADLAAVGSPIPLQEVNSASAGYLVQQFGPGAKRLFDRNKGVKISAAPVDLTGKGQQGTIVAKLEGPGVCGRVLGCPWRVLQIRGQEYRTVLNGFGSGRIFKMPVARGAGGWRDLAAELPSGYVVYGWGGTSYGIAEKASDQGGRS